MDDMMSISKRDLRLLTMWIAVPYVPVLEQSELEKARGSVEAWMQERNERRHDKGGTHTGVVVVVDLR
jgi:hypothetical protein